MNRESRVKGPAAAARRRRLSLLDAMVLVAAAALAFASPGFIGAMIPTPYSAATWDRRQYVRWLGALVLFWWTLALVPLMMSGPRPRFRRVMRNPGSAAVAAVLTMVLCLIALQVPMQIQAMWQGKRTPFSAFQLRSYDVMERVGDASACSVLAVRAHLALSRTGRQTSDWPDRLGRLVGWLWILLSLFNIFVWYMPIPWLKRGGINW